MNVEIGAPPRSRCLRFFKGYDTDRTVHSSPNSAKVANTNKLTDTCCCIASLYAPKPRTGALPRKLVQFLPPLVGISMYLATLPSSPRTATERPQLQTPRILEKSTAGLSLPTSSRFRSGLGRRCEWNFTLNCNCSARCDISDFAHRFGRRRCVSSISGHLRPHSRIIFLTATRLFGVDRRFAAVLDNRRFGMRRLRVARGRRVRGSSQGEIAA